MYEFELTRQAVGITEGMRPGLSRDQVIDLISASGLFANEEAIVWWTWHDGFPRPFRHGLRHPQMSLSEALSMRESMRLGTDIGDWPPTWLPLAGEGTKYSVAAQLVDASSPLIRTFGTDEPAFDLGDRPFAVSLCTPVSLWVDALRNGWETWSPTTLWTSSFQNYPPEWLRSGLV